MRWLIVRLRGRRIKHITLSRLRDKYMRDLDNKHQADLCAQFEMRRRRITAQDAKAVRAAKRCGMDWQKLEETLERTRIQRILGWEVNQ